MVTQQTLINSNNNSISNNWLVNNDKLITKLHLATVVMSTAASKSASWIFAINDNFVENTIEIEKNRDKDMLIIQFHHQTIVMSK